jgi:uncharacterized membrane protein
VGGGAIGFEIIAHRIVSRGDDGSMRGLAKDFGAMGLVFAASSALVLGFGIWAVVVHSNASFSDTWIWLSLVITAALFLMGPLFFAPTAKRLIADSEAKGGTHPEVVGRAKRALLVAHVDTVAALFVVYLMVVKPGA